MPTSMLPAPPNPPRNYFGVWQRLFRGYGPLAVFAVLLLLMALLIPSRVPDKADVSSSDTNSPSVTNSGGYPVNTTPGETLPGGGTVPGGTQAPGSGAPPAAAGVGVCTDRNVQVPNDPYSPPCFTFSGNNGGETSKGVTATEIHVAYRLLNEKGFQQTLAELAGATLVDTPETVRRTVEALGEYFNTYFQFYGRKIVFDFYDGVGSSTTELLGGGRDKAEADATKVADELGSFADLSAGTEPYGDALSRRGVVNFGVPYLSREWMSSRRPYSWSLATDCSIVTEEVANYVLARLAGRNAKFAGGNLKDKPRVITALAPENSWYQECVDAGVKILNDNGYQYEVQPFKYALNLSTMSNQATNLIPQFEAAGITTIVCGCDPIMPVFLSGVANREGYYPEFINIGVALDDFDLVGQLWNPNFVAHSFGISALSDEASRPPTEGIGYQAYKKVRTDEPAFAVDIIYYQMYMLAIGVHMAGPNLTPDNFETGMFAYPKSFGPAGLWGFGPQDYTPQDDVREIYWDPNAISNYNGRPGAWVNPHPELRYPHGPDQFPYGDPDIPVPAGP